MTIQNCLSLRTRMKRLRKSAHDEWVVSGWEIVAMFGSGIVIGALISVGLILAGGA